MSIEAMKQTIDFAKYCLEEIDMSDMASNQAKRLIKKSRQAIADFEKQEPFGYVMRDEIIEQLASVNCGTIYRLPAEGRLPLFTHPQPKREPLTDEQIYELLGGYFISHWGNNRSEYHLAIARAIEAAHGIKENT